MKDITKISIEELMDLIDRGKVSTTEANRAYNQKIGMYREYWLSKDMKVRKRGHIKLEKKYYKFIDAVKARSEV